MARAFGSWLAPAFGGLLELRPDLDAVEALNPEREALWARLALLLCGLRRGLRAF